MPFPSSALLLATVTSGESNSVLVIGPRGTGKTHMVETVIKEARDETGGDFLRVSLNGLTETNDRTALKRITKQLKLDNVVGDRVR